MPFDHVLPFPGETGYFHVALKKLQCCIHDCAAFILFPICRTNDRTGVGTALRVARRTRLGTFDGLLFESAVIDDCQGVAFAALLRAVHARREGVVHLRRPGGLGYLGLPRKIQLESVLRVDVLGPFLSSRGAGDTKQQNADECRRAHNAPSPAGFYFASAIESTPRVVAFASRFRVTVTFFPAKL